LDLETRHANRFNRATMPPRILIAPDKFKGTLTAQAAARAIARGWRAADPKAHITQLPISDGGDGFGEILSAIFGARAVSTRAVNAAHQPCNVRWWWEPRSKTAIIESARVIGLAMLPPGRFHPFALDTFGLGLILRAAARKGARRCLVGIGGSATNDGGFGMARAFDWKFLDKAGREIGRWTELDKLATIQPPRHRLLRELLVAVDVQNKLLGARGCSRIYGPQKGLQPRDFASAEQCLRQLASVMGRYSGHNGANEPGSGAAGGLGFGLCAFAGGRLIPGFDLVARHAKISQHLRRTDLVVTGEGSIDRSTLMGKGVGELARLCRAANIPCLGLGGGVQDQAAVRQFFSAAHGLSEITSLTKAKAQPAHWLEKLAQKTAANWGAPA
jgi:glycerate kinase